MRINKAAMFLLGFCCLPVAAMAKTVPFDLNITGQNITVHKSLEISDLGEGKTAINFDFKDDNGKKYSFDLKYSKLAENRSYPSNLDITMKDNNGAKLGYLFFAINMGQTEPGK